MEPDFLNYYEHLLTFLKELLTALSHRVEIALISKCIHKIVGNA